MTEADRIKELEARVAELERRLSGVPMAPPPPPPTGPAYDARPIRNSWTYFDCSPPVSKMSGYRK